MEFIKNNPFATILSLLGLVGVSLLVFGSSVSANPSYWLRQNNGSTITATTSRSYMTPGAATTTYYMDVDPGVGTRGAASGVLAMQFIGSTTPVNAAVSTTTYNMVVEYAHSTSQNCATNPTACDWYSDALLDTASSTANNNISVSRTHSIILGANTLGGSLNATTTPVTRMFEVPMPVRYARVLVSIPLGSTNGSVWAEFIAKKENN